MAPGQRVALPATTGAEVQYRIVWFKTTCGYANEPSFDQTSQWHLGTNRTLDLPKHTDLTAFSGAHAPGGIILRVAEYTQAWYRKNWRLVCMLDGQVRRGSAHRGSNDGLNFTTYYLWEVAVLLERPRRWSSVHEKERPPPYQARTGGDSTPAK